MTPRALIDGDYADLRFVKSRSVAQMVVEFPIERGAELVKMFGAPIPGEPVRVAVARLVEGSVAQLDEHRASNAKDAGSNPVGAAKRSWSEISLAQQAGIRCGEPAFWTYLSQLSDEAGTNKPLIESADKAADYVRLACQVHSRADLDKSAQSRRAWRDIDLGYQAWLQAAEVV